MSKTKRGGGFGKAIIVVLILALVLVVIYCGLQILKPTLPFDDPEQTPPSGKTITVDGVEYFPRQDITVLMILGIDKYGPVQSSDYYRNDGDADMIALLVFDDSNGVCDMLCLNRDSMVEMSVLGVMGDYAGTAYGQLALSHTYGTGLQDSCENVRTTLHSLLPGAVIDYYVSMNMDAIAILNDAVGGVTVHVTDDFSAVDPSIGMGTVTLHGEQARNYVQTRKDVGDQLNISRIEREKDYMEGFLKALTEKNRQEEGFVVSAYEQAADYIVTDCSVQTISSLVERYIDFDLDRVLTPKGENHMGNEHYEFYIDEDDLNSIILDLFYAKK